MSAPPHIQASTAIPPAVQERLDALFTTCFDTWEDCSYQHLPLAHELTRTARAVGDQFKLAFGLRFTARLHGLQGEQATALGYLFEALAEFDALGNDRQRAACQNEIGNAYLGLADYDDALSFFEQSLETCAALGSEKGRQVGLFLVAQVQHKLRNLDRALECAAQSLEIVNGLAERSVEAEVRSFMGEVHTAVGRRERAKGLEDAANAAFERALLETSRSLELSIIEGEPGPRAAALTALCEVLTELGRFDTAMRVGQDALDATAGLENPSVRAHALVTMGRLHLRRDRAQLALEPMQRALEVFESLEARDGVARTHHDLSQARKALGQFDLALEHFERFYDLDAQIRSQAAERRAQALAVNLEITKARHETELQRIRNLELAAMNAELERMAKEDALTGLANRRSLKAHASAAFAEARAKGEPLTLMVADIDHFKTINDRYSHAVGDQVLVAVAGILRAHCRATDLAARSGGEEFVLVLRGVSEQRAFEVCERVRAAIEGHDWEAIQPGLGVTISVGYCDDASLEHHERMLGLADAHLYDAKRAGRNRVHPVWGVGLE